MKRSEIPIPLPCHEDWDTMTVEGRRRFCGVCQTHVHDLSRMTEVEGRALLAERADESLCVRYLVDHHDDVLFGLVETGFVPVARLTAKPRSVSVLLGAGAIAGLTALMACGPPKTAVYGAPPMPTAHAGAPAMSGVSSAEPAPNPSASSTAPTSAASSGLAPK